MGLFTTHNSRWRLLKKVVPVKSNYFDSITFFPLDLRISTDHMLCFGLYFKLWIQVRNIKELYKHLVLGDPRAFIWAKIPIIWLKLSRFLEFSRFLVRPSQLGLLGYLSGVFPVYKLGSLALCHWMNRLADVKIWLLFCRLQLVDGGPSPHRVPEPQGLT